MWDLSISSNQNEKQNKLNDLNLKPFPQQGILRLALFCLFVVVPD